MSLPNFVQLSTLLKFSKMINQTVVQRLSKALQIMLQHNLPDILDTSKFQLQTKNLNITK